MIKNLLSLALMSSLAIGANAYNVDDMIYTRAAKYKVTAANLVTNGELKGASLDGWTATDATIPLADVFTVGEDGGVTVNAGQNDFTSGMYQVIPVSDKGIYLVSMKVKGTEAGFTDLDQNKPATNYIFAYSNSDGSLSTVSGTTLSFGENGSAIENCYSFTADDYTDMYFPVEAEADSKIVIDLRALATGLEITNIECHKVEEVLDERVAQARLNWIKYILNGFDWTSEYEYYDDVLADVAALEDAIKNGGNVNTYLDNLNNDFESFTEANLANVFDAIPTTDGSSNAGNNSANWMNWTGHWNSLGYSERNGQYTGKAPWSWTTDRWCHKQAKVDGKYLAEENVPMQIQWMRDASGDWDNIATLTCNLDKGTYFYSVEGQGGMMTLNKNRWMRHSGYECAATQIFLGVDGAATAADTLDCGMLPTKAYKAYINKYIIAENSKVNLGIRCNQSLDVKNGFDVFFANPVLYKVLVKGELTPSQKTYLALVETQIANLEERIKVAEELVATTQTEKPWGKENLQKGIDAAKARLEAWKKYDQKAILDIMDDGTASFNVEGGTFYVDGEYVTKDSVYTADALCDVIEAAGTTYLNREFIDVFNAVNTPLTDMPAAIEAAKEAKAQRLFSSSSKMADLESEITKAENLYKEKLAAAYSADNAQALVDAKAALAQLVEDFKAAIKAEVLVDIDFEGASFQKHEDPSGEADTYYTLAGKVGEMKFAEVADALGTTLFELGYRASAEVEVDSIGMLRVGGGSATVDFNAAPVNSDEIVRVSFDYFFGNLITKSAGYYLTAGTDTVCGLFCSVYDGKDTYNTLGVDYASVLTKVGSGSASNAAIASVASNRSHFEIILDYGTKTMYCTTISGKGTFTTAEVALNPEQKVTGFILTSDYSNNTDRRCWFDNLKIESISVGAATGISEVAAVAKASKAIKAIENGKLVIKTDKGTFNAVGAQIK